MRTAMRKLLFAYLMCGLVPAGLSFGADVEKELEGVKKRIRQERWGMKKAKEEESSILGGLEKVERDLEAKGKHLSGITAKLEILLLDHRDKEREVEWVESSLGSRRDNLAKRARALYRWHRGGSPFILLNGVFSVGDLMRRRRYLELMMAKDRDLLDGLLREARRQETLSRELAKKREDLERERKSLVQVRESIRLKGEKKRKILDRLHREKEMRSRILKELKQAARRLEEMMDEMGRRSEGRTPVAPAGKGFASFKGKLDYPVRGQMVGGFGRTRHPEFPAAMFRKGIDFKAPLGEQIRAVQGGRVIFADRFFGYGKMIVIDHGQRYYTIYAHLSELLRKSGEPVRLGDPIALVGDTESLGGSRLYFEIRKGIKPLNPLPWFRQE